MLDFFESSILFKKEVYTDPHFKDFFEQHSLFCATGVGYAHELFSIAVTRGNLKVKKQHIRHLSSKGPTKLGVKSCSLF